MSFRILNFLRNFSFYLTRTDVFTIIRITSVICNFKIPLGPAFQDSLNYWSLTLNLMMNKTKLIPIHRWQVNSWQQFQHLLLIHLKVLSKQCLKKKIWKLYYFSIILLVVVFADRSWLLIGYVDGPKVNILMGIGLFLSLGWLCFNVGACFTPSSFQICFQIFQTKGSY